jgi:superfamily II DNA/RNA helicase
MPREIADLAAHMLREPARVAVTPVASTAERISQRVVLADRAHKPTLLAEVLRGEANGQTIVFTRTKHGADKVARNLTGAGHPAEAIHGNKSQNQRERVLNAFRSGKLKTLVATDIAARGIDVTGISLVINYDLPNVPESYVHRIGRTARAGAEGVAISFCDHEEMAYLRDIEKLIGTKLAVTDRRSAPRAGAPAQHHRPAQHAGRPGSHKRGQQQRHGHGKRPNGGHQGQPRGQNPNRHAPAAQSSPDNIATVAFMRRPERRQNTGDSNRGAR